MKRIEILNNAYMEIENFRSKFGETFNDAYQEDDNYTYEISKSIIGVFDMCETERDVEIADRMLIATCGYCLESLINRIEQRDNDDYEWESC